MPTSEQIPATLKQTVIELENAYLHQKSVNGKYDVVLFQLVWIFL